MKDKVLERSLQRSERHPPLHLCLLSNAPPILLFTTLQALYSTSQGLCGTG
jgi:hypothetical protein